MKLEDKVIVTEGAMGTQLQAAGLDVSENAEVYNLSEPDVVEGVHRAYREAGAGCAITNTFSPCTSTDEAELEKADQMVRAAVELARKANPDGVLGDVGPCTLVMEPLGPATFDRSFEVYCRHIGVLANAGVDAILLETFIDIADMRAAMLAARSVCSLPIIVSCTYKENGRMFLSSTTCEAATVVAESLGASMVGLNCGMGPSGALPIVERISKVTGLPLIVEPNAGIPQMDDDGVAHYPGTAQDQAEHARIFADLGCKIIGSCCGSDPTFTSAISAALDGYKPVEEDRGDSITRLASQQEMLAEVDGKLDTSAMMVLDCSGGPFDKWDVLENLDALPFVVEYGSASSPNYDNLDEVLKVYPGRAVVQMQTLDSRAAEIASYYGAAVMIPSETRDVDAVARCAVDSGIAPRDILLLHSSAVTPDTEPGSSLVTTC